MRRGSFGILQKKRLTKAQFADDKSFKSFRRNRSAGNKMNLRSDHENPRFLRPSGDAEG